MAVDLLSYGKMDDQVAIQEAATAGLHSLEHLVHQLSRKRPPVDCRDIADETVAKFKRMISVLNRTGHARFRRGPPPVAPPSVLPETLAIVPVPLQTTPTTQLPPPPPLPLTLDFSKPTAEPAPTAAVGVVQYATEGFSISATGSSSGNSSFFSSLTGDGSVNNGKQGPFALVPPVAGVVTSGKPPLSSSYKKQCAGHGNAHSADPAGKQATGSRCHCTKKRRSRVKRTIRVPAISSRIADIPPDEYSWRKYGQKPIKASPYPRGYYRCSTVRGCPARKHVERAADDPSMLIVTYEDEHRHGAPPTAGAVIVEST